jgi:hypothetical protein
VSEAWRPVDAPMTGSSYESITNVAAPQFMAAVEEGRGGERGLEGNLNNLQVVPWVPYRKRLRVRDICGEISTLNRV